MQFTVCAGAEGLIVESRLMPANKHRVAATGNQSMKFIETSVSGVMLVEFDCHIDERGSFRRLWSQHEAESANVGRPIVQSSVSITRRRGTLRGMHFQLPPSREDKIVQCVRGRIFDVALDLRRNSTTYLKHFGTELSETQPSAVFIPTGCAHGFLTLDDECTVIYMMTDYYDPVLSTGVRWNDPAFAISWPEEPTELLERDNSYGDFDEKVVEAFGTRT